MFIDRISPKLVLRRPWWTLWRRYVVYWEVVDGWAVEMVPLTISYTSKRIAVQRMKTFRRLIKRGYRVRAAF